MDKITKFLRDQQRDLNRKKQIVKTFPLNVPACISVEYHVQHSLKYQNKFIVIGTHFSLESFISLRGIKLAIERWDTETNSDLTCSISCIKKWSILDKTDYPLIINWFHVTSQFYELFKQA
jgi:hypothetical protein